MEITQKKHLEKDQQINRMMDDGLGAGRIIEEVDQKKLKQPDTQDKRKNTSPENGTMVQNEKELIKLGNEMESLQNSRLKAKKKVPDPIQHDNK